MSRDVTLRCVVRRNGRFLAHLLAGAWATVLLAVLPACSDKTIEAYPEQLAGIGVVLKANAGGFVIGTVVDGGPAAEAGLKSGDQLLEVNGRPTDGQTLANVVDSLRGNDGSDVVVRIEKAGASEVHTLKRRRLARAGDGYQARQ